MTQKFGGDTGIDADFESKNYLPIEVKINLWDFIDIEKLNNYIDDFTGEIISGLTYTFNDKVEPNGETIITVDGDIDLY